MTADPEGDRHEAPQEAAEEFLHLAGDDSDISRYEFDSPSPESLEFDIQDLRSCYERYNGIFVHPHRHSFAHIIWIKNSGTQYVDFNEYHHSDNALYFIAPNQIHWFPTNAEPEGKILFFNEAYLNSSPVMSRDYSAELFDGFFSSPFVQLGADCTTELASLLHVLEVERQRPRGKATDELVVCILTALVVLARRCKTEASVPCLSMPAKDDAVFLAFKKMLGEDFTTHHMVAHYSSRLFVSDHKLSDICRRRTGLSAKHLITERVMLEAKRYLLYSDMSVSQIASRLGFQDSFYFSRAFKARCSTAPSTFRARIAASSPASLRDLSHN
ncbi:MAG: helix-turn-helix domain-containing protein [Thermoleophilia bacterium]